MNYRKNSLARSPASPGIMKSGSLGGPFVLISSETGGGPGGGGLGGSDDEDNAIIEEEEEVGIEG
jgi:hypothetical protein